MTWSGIGENLLSDIIFLVLSILLGSIIFIFFNRNKKLAFFGIIKRRRIVVYVANLRIREKGALGIDGTIRSYAGFAVAYQEIVCANQFRDFFNYLIPSLAEKPNFISKLLISDVKVEVLISPIQASSLEEQTSFITLGSPAYNAASKYLQDNHLSQAKFNFGIKTASANPYPSGENNFGEYTGGTVNAFADMKGDTGIAIPSGIEMGVALESSEQDEAENKSGIQIEGLPSFDQTTYGFIERINDMRLGRKFFYVAGLSELATAGAAYHLLSQWADLEKKYGKDTPFIRMVSIDPTDYRKSSVVFEK